MAYDEHLASRIRKALGGAPGITEKRMFGGLAFRRAHPACAATGTAVAVVVASCRAPLAARMLHGPGESSGGRRTA